MNDYRCRSIAKYVRVLFRCQKVNVLDVLEVSLWQLGYQILFSKASASRTTTPNAKLLRILKKHIYF